MDRPKLLAVLRRWVAPSPRSAAESDYEEAVAAIRALKSLFEGELARRQAGRNDGTKTGD